MDWFTTTVIVLAVMSIALNVVWMLNTQRLLRRNRELMGKLEAADTQGSINVSWGLECMNEAEYWRQRYQRLLRQIDPHYEPVKPWTANWPVSSAPPDGPNPSTWKPSELSTARVEATPERWVTMDDPSDFSSSGTGGFDTRGRVLTIGLTPMSTPELLTPSTAMTSSVGSEPGSSGHAATRQEDSEDDD